MGDAVAMVFRLSGAGLRLKCDGAGGRFPLGKPRCPPIFRMDWMA
ncbi:hypothetical protein GFS31_28290 [Leptolyngbya sp. BL0902]|nr:hypothetical protein GFS31_28290 [Leptolyngbya sp. BL0902]